MKMNEMLKTEIDAIKSRINALVEENKIIREKLDQVSNELAYLHSNKAHIEFDDKGALKIEADDIYIDGKIIRQSKPVDLEKSNTIMLCSGERKVLANDLDVNSLKAHANNFLKLKEENNEINQ